ncbi:hypothetical protein KGY71_06130 [Candidatus Bipolaricaulota bacterium]|nr:hypothetical protein [Candidatus Bipolaricaulota bacterium]
MTAGLVQSDIPAASLEFSRFGALPLSLKNKERVKSEAEIGRGDFHAGEIAPGFVERFPKL